MKWLRNTKKLHDAAGVIILDEPHYFLSAYTAEAQPVSINDEIAWSSLSPYVFSWVVVVDIDAKARA